VVDYDLLYESDGIYRTDILGRKFLYRLLTFREYRVLKGLSVSGVMNRQAILMEAFRKCYIGDVNLLNQKTPVGIYLSIGQLIMYFSGDCERETLKTDIAIARSIYPAHSVHERMRHTIFLAFSSYTIDDSDKWTRPELIKKFIVAEHALLQRGLQYTPVNVDEILSPEEFQEQNSKPEEKTPIKNIDFDAASKTQRENLGFWDEWDIEEEVDKSKRKLTVSQAKKLDKLTAARR